MSFLYRRMDANSTKATGPVTDAGKVISSQNARKHGLSAPPENALVSQWFNLILSNSWDDLEEPSARDPRRKAALRLAIAEARYHRALHKAETHDSEPGSAQRLAIKLRQEIWEVLDEMPKNLADGPIDRHALAYVNFASKQLGELFIQISHERRLYKRYLSEARAQRAKALRAWCALNQHEHQNSQNEHKLQPRKE